MAKIFQETGDLNEHPLRAPFGKNAVLAADKPAGPKLLWYNDDTEPSWSPYCVHIFELKNGVLTFQFVKSDEGGGAADVVGNKCTVRLDAFEDVWPHFPSTIDPNLNGAPAAGREYALLFFSKAYTDRTQQAGDSGGTTSKWPRGSEWFMLVRKLVRLVQPQAQPLDLTDWERAMLKSLGAGWL